MAEPIRVFTSQVIPIDAENVDTDQIVPARYLKVTDKAGLADALFRDWRSRRTVTQGPVHPRSARDMSRAILLVGGNFGRLVARARAVGPDIMGCPSDPLDELRRHLPQQQPEERVAAHRGRTEVHRRLRDLIERDPDARLTVDLSEQGVLLPDGSTIEFDIDPFAKQMLLAGTDELGYLLTKEPDIARWRRHTARIETRIGA